MSGSSTSASQPLTSHFIIQSMPVKLRIGRVANRGLKSGVGMLLQVTNLMETEGYALCSKRNDPNMYLCDTAKEPLPAAIVKSLHHHSSFDEIEERQWIDAECRWHALELFRKISGHSL